jgi:hypothetical protein
VSIAPITPALPGVDSIAPIAPALPGVDQYPTVLARRGVVCILEQSRIVLGSGRAVPRVTDPMVAGSTLASGCSSTILHRHGHRDTTNSREVDCTPLTANRKLDGTLRAVNACPCQIQRANIILSCSLLNLQERRTLPVSYTDDKKTEISDFFQGKESEHMG